MISAWDAASTVASWAATSLGVINMVPIILPPPSDRSWSRAETIARALRAKKKSNPWVVAAIVNAYAESGWRPIIVGDHGQSYGPWQIKYAYYGEAILAATNVDIRSEGDLARHVDALLFLLSLPPYAKVSAELDAATTGAEATRAFTADFERASAEGAIDRRVAIAGKIEVWLAGLAL